MSETNKTQKKICKVCGTPFLPTSKNAKYCSDVCARVARINAMRRKRAEEKKNGEEFEDWVKERNKRIDEVNESYRKKAAQTMKPSPECPQKSTCRWGIFLHTAGMACNYFCITGELIPKDEMHSGNCSRYEPRKPMKRGEAAKEFNKYL